MVHIMVLIMVNNFIDYIWCMRVDRFFVCELRSAKLTASAETQGCGCRSMLMIGQLILVDQSKRMNFHANKNMVQTFLEMSLWCLDQRCAKRGNSHSPRSHSHSQGLAIPRFRRKSDQPALTIVIYLRDFIDSCRKSYAV